MPGRLVDLGLYPLASGYTGAGRPGPGRASGVLAGSGSDGDRRHVPGQISALAAIEYAAYAAALTNPAWQGAFEPVPLLDARNAGVRGVVVAWTAA